MGGSLAVVNSPDHFDYIVIGVGAMGSSTCYNLSKRGYSVLGLDQFDIPNELSSHAGQSRIIRKAYFEHPDYIPLLESAYTNWANLEKVANKKLYFETGLLYVGLADHPVLKSVQTAANDYEINLEELKSNELREKYPQFSVPDNFIGLFEPKAGFLMPERAIKTFVEQSIISGATISANEKVVSWEWNNNKTIVTTNKVTYTCDKLVITAGPWASELIPNAQIKLKVTKQVLGWYQPKNVEHFKMDKFPCWLIADEEPGVHYGFPSLEMPDFDGLEYVKMGYHFPGNEINPNQVDRNLTKVDEAKLAKIFDKYFPDEFIDNVKMKSCLYTNSQDENFIIDALPEYGNDVILAAGFSGHGFKFASIVGEILADLAVDGKTYHPIDFLRLSRFESKPVD